MEQEQKKKMISIIIPVYNEEEVLLQFFAELKLILNLIKYKYEIIFINDGSYDNTQKIIESLKNKNNFIKYISFSRNFGHQAALTAGLENSKGDAVIMMDADLQHPPDILIQLIESWENGFEIVYTKRKNDKKISFFKRMTSNLFYKIIRTFSDIQLEYNVADFRLMSRKTINALNSLPEKTRFIRGLVKWLGFKSTSISFTAPPRQQGETKYTLKKMLDFALNGIISFSTLPIHLMSIFGFFVSICSFIYLIWVIIEQYLGNTVSGWSTIVGLILLMNGIQFIMLGILGEYISKIYKETKSRPVYIVDKHSLD